MIQLTVPQSHAQYQAMDYHVSPQRALPIGLVRHIVATNDHDEGVTSDVCEDTKSAMPFYRKLGDMLAMQPPARRSQPLWNNYPNG